MSRVKNPIFGKVKIQHLTEWLAEAGSAALSDDLRRDVVFKGDGTPTTPADHRLEELLLGRISTAYPQHRIVTEETGAHGDDSEWVWVIDPIDGTRAYASGLPTWAISVGVLFRGQPYLGAVHLPELGRMYWGSASGAFDNGEAMPKLSAADIDPRLAFVAVPSSAHRVFDLGFPRVRSLGSTVAHLASVARGSAWGVLTRQIKIWDIAGMLPILQQTGIQLSYLSGQPFVLSELLDGSPAPEPLLAAHPAVMKQVRAGVKTRAG